MAGFPRPIVKGAYHNATLDMARFNAQSTLARRSNDYQAFMPGMAPTGDAWKDENVYPRRTFADAPLGMVTRPPQNFSGKPLGPRNTAQYQYQAVLQAIQGNLTKLMANTNNT